MQKIDARTQRQIGETLRRGKRRSMRRYIRAASAPPNAASSVCRGIDAACAAAA